MKKQQQLKQEQQKVLIGGPLLGTINLTNAIIPKSQQQQQKVKVSKSQQKDLLFATTNNNIQRTFEPIITKKIRIHSSTSTITNERLLLLPHNHYITINSYKTGKTIGYFVVQQQDDDDNDNNELLDNNNNDGNANDNNNTVSIMCCTVVQKQNLQQILLVGCSNGTIQEFNVNNVLSEVSLLQKDQQQQQQQHNILLPGPIYIPQRVYQIVVPSSSSLSSDTANKKSKNNKNDSTLCIYHLASILLSSSISSSLTVYAYTVSWDKNDKLISSILCIHLPQVITPNQQEKTITSTTTTTTTIAANIVCTDSNNKPIVHKNDIAFQFFAMSIVPVSNKGGLFTNSSSSSSSSSNSNNTDAVVIVLAASAKKLSIYCHDSNNNNAELLTELFTTTIHVPMNDYNYNNHSNVNTYDLLTAITTSNYSTNSNTNNNNNNTSPNNIDITCGYQSGTIRIFVNAIHSILQYHTDNQLYLLQQQQLKSNNTNTSSILPILKPTNPFDTKHNSNTNNNRIIIRKLHWHAHPVLSLRYDSNTASSSPGSTGNGNGLLYSGGIESVLVIWQLSQGTFKPADYLPRISMGSIEQISVVPINSTSSSNDDDDDDDVDTILLYCSDNTLQLLDSISKNCIWKIRGLATTSIPITTTGSSMIRHPIVHIPSSLNTSTTGSSSSTSSMIAITCLPNAPGCIQLYNPNNQCVISSLQVVPFNRVSRTDPIYVNDGQIIDDIDTTIPYPYVSHTSWNDTTNNTDSNNNTSTNLKTLVTVDVVPTENDCVGKKERLPNGQVYGTTTTLRFWEYITYYNNNNSSPTPESSSSVLLDSYQQVACMTYPHGRANTVSAIAVSPNGLYVITVSNDEKAFRLWQRQRSVIDHDYDYDNDNTSTTDIDSDYFQQQNKKRKRLSVGGTNTNNNKPEWYCRCKVSTPASLSYYTTGISAVSFSNDSTVIVIGYGTTISLWDYKSVTLITCHRHGIENIPKQIHQTTQQQQLVPIIDSIQFITSQLLPMDVLVSKSKTTVVVQSIYGPRDDFGWIWEIVPNEIHFVHISNITYISSHNVIAIALYNTKQNNTCIVLVNATTGKLYNNSNNNHNNDSSSSINSSMHNNNVFDNIIGEVVALAPASGKSIMTLPKQQQQQPIQMYAIMDSGEMLLLISNTSNTSYKEKGNTVVTTNTSEDLFLTNNNGNGGVPTIPVLASIEKQRIENEKQEKYQQKVTVLTIDDIVRKRNLQQQVSSIVSISNFGSLVRTTEQQQQQQSSSSVQNSDTIGTGTSQILPTRDLPQLDGSFALSFLSRSIQRGNE